MSDSLDISVIKKLKVVELKAALSARGLSTKGKKDELVKRLVEAMESDSEQPKTEDTPQSDTEVAEEATEEAVDTSQDESQSQEQSTSATEEQPEQSENVDAAPSTTTDPEEVTKGKIISEYNAMSVYIMNRRVNQWSKRKK